MARVRIMPEKEVRRALFRGLRVIIAAGIALCFIAAAFERHAEPSTFTSYPLALYWAVVTIATVGYGDIVPHTGEGRAMAAVIIVFAMAWIPAVTSLVVSTINQQSDNRVKELRIVLTEIAERLERIEEQIRKP